MGLTGSGLFHLGRSAERSRVEVERTDDIEVVDIEIVEDDAKDVGAGPVERDPYAPDGDQPIAEFVLGLVDDGESEEGQGAELAGPDGGTEEPMAASIGGGGDAVEPIGYFDTSPKTPQIVSRARAAEEDFERRTQALAARASGILERLGGVKAAAGVPPQPVNQATEPDIEIVNQPATASQPEPVPPKPVPPKPVASKPVPPKPVAPKPVVTVTNSTPPRPEPAPITEVVDAIDRLRVLVRMFDEGLISRAEFDAKKADVLSRI